jgi:pimeloyl-ACP methyl ester carboxylesterase
MVYFQIPMLIVIAFLVILIPSGAILTTTNNYFSIINFAYGQTNQTNSNNANSLNIQNIPVKKAHVGDIDIAYKTFGKGEPFLLIGGLGAKMDSWEPSILRNLSTNHTVIVFDNRGVGNTTVGTKPFSIQQFVNDTNGLLDALKIQKADVLGHSMGSFVAQQLAVTHPEKVNRLILVAASCGGKESIPPSPQAVQLGSEMIKNATNNVPISNVRTITSLNQGSAWMKSHPNFLQDVPEHLNFSELISVPLNTYKKDFGAVQAWESTNWSGVCDKLTKVSSPTLIITGTADNSIPPANSLIIASKIPGAWLVHIKDASHILMDQYPDKFNKVLQTFLSTTN